MTKQRGVDVSFYQAGTNQLPITQIDWSKMPVGGAKFAWIRAGQGRWSDVCFAYNHQHSKSWGMLRGPYWFYDWRPGYDPGPEAQAERLMQITKEDFGEFGATLDFERPSSTWPTLPSRANCLSLIDRFYNRLEKAGLRADVFYTNVDFLRNHLGQVYPDSLKRKKLWLAWYPTIRNAKGAWDHGLWLSGHLATGVMPILPDVKWAPTFWQFTDRLHGPTYGTVSQQVDGNYFFGSETDLAKFAGTYVAPPPVIPPVSGVIILKVMTPTVLIRKDLTHNANGDPVGTTLGSRKLGDRVTVEAIKTLPTGVWVRDRLGWSAVYHKSIVYMDTV